MARVIVSDHNRNQLFQVQYANNIKWRKALDTMGYASFDIDLGNLYASPQWLHAGNYVHIYSDTADSTSFANADWGGILSNDYEIKPRDGIVTIAAAGLAQLLQVSIVPTTQIYTGVDLGSIVVNLVSTRDNAVDVNFTQFSVSGLGPVLSSYTAGFGDITYQDIIKLMQQYGCDFEVRPDFSYGFYIRQGQDRPDLVCRYGNHGNMVIDSMMHLVNSELGNQIYYQNGSQSETIFVANTTSAQFYGKKSLVIQDDGSTYVDLDLQTRAQVELAHRAFPLFALDNVQIVDTPLYPFSQINLGDRVLFEAPSLPFLQSFNGLQRVLAIDYDDVNRIMSLTLGNAVYVVLRGKLHELRLYT